MVVKVNGVAQNFPDPSTVANHISNVRPPWWDIAGNLEYDVHQFWHHVGVMLLHGLSNGLAVVLPTLAVVGILWWMIPFFPKSHRGIKLTGASLLVYMFYVLIMGAYS